MIRGCFTNIFAGIGCLTVCALIAVVAWVFRTEIAEVYRNLVVRDRGELVTEQTIGRSSEIGLRAAEEKEVDIARRIGPDSTRLDADEIASLIVDRLTVEARSVLDSIRVILEPDRISLTAILKTQEFGRDLLGPLRGMIDLQEPISLSGVPAVRAPGVIGWDIDEFLVASFPFPGPTIPVLVDRLTGREGGDILVAVPTEVGDLRVSTDGVTFYRRVH